ncbi:MAG: hypothetical protein FWD25_00695 [Clostridia bacterium]|nr:hypothetical protein [Clostridia bacterium]
MDEHVLLEQIAGLLEAQSTQLRQEMQEGFSAQETRFDAIDKRFEAVDKRFEAVDKRFEAVDKRLDEMTAEIVDVVHMLGKQMEQYKADTIHEMRILAENIEGDKIRILADETSTHKVTLTDHEQRIVHLETLVSAG